MFLAQTFVWLLSIYVLLGIVFALCFIFAGIERVDAAAKQSAWGFRLMIVPGVIALWPLLAVRWMRGAGHPPLEQNAHRQAAREVKL